MRVRYLSSAGRGRQLEWVEVLRDRREAERRRRVLERALQWPVEMRIEIKKGRRMVEEAAATDGSDATDTVAESAPHKSLYR